MKVRLSFIVLAFGFLAFPAFSQDKALNGRVYNEEGKALPWVNIGIRNKDLGTVSAEDGTFALRLAGLLDNDTLKFSAVGYHELRVSVKDLDPQQYRKVVLHRRINQLKEVVITNKKPRINLVGIDSYTPEMWVGLSLKEENSYAEIAQLIPISSTARLISVNVGTAGFKGAKDSVSFRLNIYKSENGSPGERLVEKSILKSFSKEAKMLRFDLRSEEIFLEEDCVLSIEYLAKDRNKKLRLLSFRANRMGKGGFSRIASIGKWIPMGSGSAAIFAELEQ